MSTLAKIGYGSSFYLWDPSAGPAAYVAIAEVTSITPPNQSVDQIDASNMDSPNRYREFIPGLTDPGECTIEMNFVPGSASDALIRARRAAGDYQNAKIEFPDGDTWTFSAFVSGYEISTPIDDKMTATLTLKVAGEITVA